MGTNEVFVENDSGQWFALLHRFDELLSSLSDGQLQR